VPVHINQNRFKPFNSLDFLARQVVEGFITGLHKSPFHGFSVEFAEHRLYNLGESTKHIDWKLYGRTDRLYVKRFEEETNLRCNFLIDNSSSMYFPIRTKPDISNPNKITFSIYATAALMHLLRRQRDAVGLNVFSDNIELQTAVRSSMAHHRHLMNELEKMLIARDIKDRRGSQLSKSLHLIAEQVHKRSLIVIFSDMMDDEEQTDALFSSLQHLKHNKHEVILFHVTDKAHEYDLEYASRPHRFIDMESGAEIRLTPSEIRDQYVSHLQAFHKSLKMKCATYKIDFIEADINKGFEQILLPYLLKRQKLY